MKREYTATIEKRGKWYIGFIEDMPGVNTQGRTLKEVTENLEDALLLMLDLRKEQTPGKPAERTIKKTISVEV